MRSEIHHGPWPLQIAEAELTSNTMPEAAGIALGLDRLIMLATGASRIEQVLWTPLDDPSQ